MHVLPPLATPPRPNTAIPQVTRALTMRCLPACRRAEEARKADIIASERRRLLAEAADVRAYLPRSVLRNQEDVAAITQGLQRLGGS